MPTRKRSPMDLMETPEVTAAREAADRAYRDFPEARNEALLRRFGGGEGTSGVAPGTIVMQDTTPDGLTSVERRITGAGMPGEQVRRTYGGMPVMQDDPLWTKEDVPAIMGEEMSPEGRGRAMAVASRPQTVAERILGPSENRAEGSGSGPAGERPLFGDEQFIVTGKNQPKPWVQLQSDTWRREIFDKQRQMRPNFASLAEYDRWFRSLPGNKPELFGDAMKEAWLAGMPDNVKREYGLRLLGAEQQLKDAPAAAAFSAASGTPVKTLQEADAVKAGTAVAAQRQAMTREQATSEWDNKPIGQMEPVDGIPGWGFVKTSTGGGQLVQLPEEKKIPFDGRKSFTEDGVLWTWNDRTQSYMGRAEKSKPFDIDPLIWLTMTPDQQQAMITAFATKPDQKEGGTVPGATPADKTEARYYSQAAKKWYTRKADGSVVWE